MTSADIASNEEGVRSALEPLMAPYVALSRKMTDAAGLVLVEIDTLPDDPRAPHVLAILLARAITDLQTVVHLVRLGYVVQGLALAAGILEVAYAAGFIGGNEERAAEWFSHSDHTKTYPPVLYNAVQDTVRTLGLPADTAERDYAAYRQLCMAKHANPIALGQIGVMIDDDAQVIHVVPGPYLDAGVERGARAALAHAIRYTWLAAVAFVHHHVTATASRPLVDALNGVILSLRELEQQDLARYGGRTGAP